MRRTAVRLATLAFVSAHAVAPARAQQWNAPRAVELAQRAVARRDGQISASMLASYSAKAKGYLTFLGQFGDTAFIPPIVVKQTQLAVDVYWRAPASSKQIVRGMRDTSLTPADIDYYADRFGIVQSNFPDRIRMGDGKDVADVLHPLSRAGLAEYDYAITDSMTYNSASTGRIEVFTLMYRPKDPRQSRVIGSAYIDVRNADIVRLDLTFTRTAILDKRIEHLSVSLENTLIEGRAWLPRRQQIEVVRTGVKFKMAVRGIIRGRWEVDDYNVNFAAPPALFFGPPIVFAPPDSLRAYKFEGGILDGLPPDVAIARDEDVRRIQKQAEDLVKAQFRDRAEKAAFSIPRISDIVRINRAEGFALGGGGQLQPFTRFAIDGRARYGFGDEEWKAEVSVTAGLSSGRAVRFFALREYVDARDVQEVSAIRNSFAAQEFGADYTDPFDVRSTGAELTLGRLLSVRWRVLAAYERHRPLDISSSPERGRYEPLIPATPLHGVRVSAFADALRFDVAGGHVRVNSELRMFALQSDVPGDEITRRAARLSMDAEFVRRVGTGELRARLFGGALSAGRLPPQLYFFAGGPTSAPGYEFDAFAGRRLASAHLEWQTSIPFPTIGLGRFGTMPGRAELIPFVHGVATGNPGVRGDREGFFPAVGIAISPVLGLLRFEFARGLRDGRSTFSLDISRTFWPIF